MAEIAGVVVCISRGVKMKEHLPFCKEISILCIKNKVVLTVFSNIDKEAVLKDSVF